MIEKAQHRHCLERAASSLRFGWLRSRMSAAQGCAAALVLVGAALPACSSEEEGDRGGDNPSAGTGFAGTTAASGGSPTISGGGAPPTIAGSAGAATVLAGSGGMAPNVPSAGRGGANPIGGAGLSGAAPSAGSAGANGSLCKVGAWPERDPALAGPFATVTEMDVGPAVGVGEDETNVAFTLFRPRDLGQNGLCHPVVTWGNGTGSNPSLYRVLLNHLASHGFVVIASNSPNVAQGDPPPMLAGVEWVIAQNQDPASPLYQRIDTTHVGGTGHSQGGFATTSAARDEKVTTIAPLCGASSQRNLHGPAFLFCGGEDTAVPCSNIQRTFDSISNQPVMLANYLTADHADWITFRGTTPSVVEIAVTAWMRVHLMGDTSLRSWFYGPSCKLCTDSAWQVTQKGMEQ